MAGSAARAGRRPSSLRFDVRLRSVFSGQRGASDAEDEDEHPERLGAQVRLKYSNTRLFVLCFYDAFPSHSCFSMTLPLNTHCAACGMFHE